MRGAGLRAALAAVTVALVASALAPPLGAAPAPLAPLPAGAAGPSPECGEPAPPGVTVEATEFEGAPREYRLAVPAAAGDDPLPLVLNFHGYSSDALQQAIYSQLEEKGPERGYVVVTPQGTGAVAFWNIVPELAAPDDVAYAGALIDATAATLCIDPRRVYSTGMSNGGGMSSYLGCQMGDRLAAIAPVAGVNLLFGDCPQGKGVSMIAFHGEADAVVPYAGGGLGAGLLQGRELAPVEETVAAWARRDGCKKRPKTRTIGTEVVLTDYRGCKQGTDVQLYSVTTGGHTWPGSLDVPRLGPVTDEINAADLMLDFFDDHRRPRKG